MKLAEALAMSGKTGVKRELKVTGRNFKEGPRTEWPGRAPCAGQGSQSILSPCSLWPLTVTQLTLLTGTRVAAAGAMGISAL